MPWYCWVALFTFIFIESVKKIINNENNGLRWQKSYLYMCSILSLLFGIFKYAEHAKEKSAFFLNYFNWVESIEVYILLLIIIILYLAYIEKKKNKLFTHQEEKILKIGLIILIVCGVLFGGLLILQCY